MILIRYLLICIVGYLLVRSFINYGGEGKRSAGAHHTRKDGSVPSKKVSKRIGEYVDYEEIKKEKR